MMMMKTPNEDLDRVSVETFKKMNKIPVVVVLDNVRSMHNVGSAFRTADAFLIQKILLTGITARPPHRDIHKTALGATESVDWDYKEDTLEAISVLKDQGYTIIAVEQATPHVPLNEFTPDKNEKYALIFGNEVFGVSDEAVVASDICLEIPQSGTKHSLNISVSVGIVLWKMYEGLDPCDFS